MGSHGYQHHWNWDQHSTIAIEATKPECLELGFQITMDKTRESSWIKQMWLQSKNKFDSGFQNMFFVVSFCLDTGYFSTHVTSTSTSTNIYFFALHTSGTFSPDTRTLRWQTSNVGSFLRRNQGNLADQKPAKKWPESDLSNEQKLSLFRVYRGWDTTRLCGDYQKPLSEFLLNNQYLMESKKVFFSWLTWNWDGKKTSAKPTNVPLGYTKCWLLQKECKNTCFYFSGGNFGHVFCGGVFWKWSWILKVVFQVTLAQCLGIPSLKTNMTWENAHD